MYYANSLKRTCGVSCLVKRHTIRRPSETGRFGGLRTSDGGSEQLQEALKVSFEKMDKDKSLSAICSSLAAFRWEDRTPRA